MRELLREVDDRLREFSPGPNRYKGPGDPGCLVHRLQEALEKVLDAGIFDGRLTAVDMRQLPRVL
ncbi:unnamed protein product [marine sediment metagenome]|uniref:Uncharacterized protein n=1 Tax=marine sediment metagenome TaxID=412755 RepID=X1J752_9ZZZZ